MSTNKQCSISKFLKIRTKQTQIQSTGKNSKTRLKINEKETKKSQISESNSQLVGKIRGIDRPLTNLTKGRKEAKLIKLEMNRKTLQETPRPRKTNIHILSYLWILSLNPSWVYNLQYTPSILAIETSKVGRDHMGRT